MAVLAPKVSVKMLKCFFRAPGFGVTILCIVKLRSSFLASFSFFQQDGSKEASVMNEVLKFYDKLNEDISKDDVILDDRGWITVGKKLREAKKTGYRCVDVGTKMKPRLSDPNSTLSPLDTLFSLGRIASLRRVASLKSNSTTLKVV